MTTLSGGDGFSQGDGASKETKKASLFGEEGIDLLLLEELDDDTFARLDRLLGESEEARREFLDRMELSAALVLLHTPVVSIEDLDGRRRVARSRAELGDPKRSDPKRGDLKRSDLKTSDSRSGQLKPGKGEQGRSWVNSRLWRMAAAVGFLTIAALAFVLTSSDPDDRERTRSGEVVAMVTRSVSASGLSTNAAEETRFESELLAGADLTQGRWLVEAANLELELDGGATLVVEAPADVELIAKDDLRVHSGRVWVDTGSSKSLRVRVGEREILSRRDSVFAVERRSTEDATTSVHVVADRIDLANLAVNEPGARRSIASGRSLHWRPGGLLNASIAKPEKFLSRERLSALARRFPRQQRRQAARRRNALFTEATLIGYCSFVDDLPRLEKLPSAFYGLRDLRFTGTEPTGGRWLTSGAAGLFDTRHRIDAEIGGSYSQLSFAAWIRVDVYLDSPTSPPRFPIFRWSRQRFIDDRGLPPGRGSPQGRGIAPARGWQGGPIVRQVGPEGQPVDSAYKAKMSLHRDHPLVLDLFEGEALPVVSPRENLHPEGRWYHVAFVYDAETRRAHSYVNGRHETTKFVERALPIELGPTVFGNLGPVNAIASFEGVLDEWMFIGRVLSAREIRALYESGKP